MKVLLADDHDLFREAIAAMVGRDGGIAVDCAADLEEVVALVGKDRFDLILLDYGMPGMNGMEGLEKLRKLVPDTPVALISGTTRLDLAQGALSRGAIGFVPKTLGVRAMIAALKLMAQGEVFAPLSMLESPAAGDPVLEELTRREREVLAGICEGKSNKEIARDLEVQEVTVKLHVKTLSRKLGARNRTHAAMIARNAGMERGLKTP